MSIINNSNEPEHFDQYPKNTPKTMDLGRHIIKLAFLAKKFNTTVNPIVSNDGTKEGINLEDFEIPISEITPLFVNELHGTGYFIRNVKTSGKNNEILLVTVSANIFSFRNLMFGV